MAAAYGNQFTNSGYALNASGLGVGSYRLVVFARSTVTGNWNAAARTVQVPAAVTALETPAAGSTVRQPFLVAGWAIDQAAEN